MVFDTNLQIETHVGNINKDYLNDNITEKIELNSGCQKACLHLHINIETSLQIKVLVKKTKTKMDFDLITNMKYYTKVKDDEALFDRFALDTKKKIQYP